MLQYWECTNHLYNHQCDPISWSIITEEELVFNLLYLPSGFFFTIFAPVTVIALLGSLLHCFSCKKKTRGQWVTRLTWVIFSRAKLWIWKQLKVDIISPWKRVLPFIWTNLNSLHPWLLSTKFGWNWSSGSGVVNVFSLLSPLENGSFKQSWIPNTKGCLLPRLVEIR